MTRHLSTDDGLPDADLLATYDRLQHLLERQQVQLQSLQRFLTADEVAELTPLLAQERDFLQRTTTALWQQHMQDIGRTELPQHPAKAADAEYDLVPRRLVRGPISMRGQLERLPAAEQADYHAFCQDRPAARRLPTYLVYWADGQRTIAEIDHLAKMETGISDIDFALRYFQLLDKLGFVALD